jgi:hypothetical protein
LFFYLLNSHYMSASVLMSRSHFSLLNPHDYQSSSSVTIYSTSYARLSVPDRQSSQIARAD